MIPAPNPHHLIAFGIAVGMVGVAALIGLFLWLWPMVKPWIHAITQ